MHGDYMLTTLIIGTAAAGRGAAVQASDVDLVLRDDGAVWPPLVAELPVTYPFRRATVLTPGAAARVRTRRADPARVGPLGDSGSSKTTVLAADRNDRCVACLVVAVAGRNG
jgi:hypothetical protein